MTHAEMFAEVMDYRMRLTKNTDPRCRPLLMQLDVIQAKLNAGLVPEEDWEEFALQFAAYTADLMREIQRQGAHIMLAIEEMELERPGIFDRDPKTQELLRWWRDEGGREEFLGNITLEERRALEAKAQEWRNRRK